MLRILKGWSLPVATSTCDTNLTRLSSFLSTLSNLTSTAIPDTTLLTAMSDLVDQKIQYRGLPLRKEEGTSKRMSDCCPVAAKTGQKGYKVTLLLCKASQMQPKGLSKCVIDFL